ncbi:MAG: S1 RNA-binding domain-containing protein, partial [Candidatus Thioglobus sp.]|nr:S1 RNA-binding domain-containing protein [Candidatus Thioglobus sp.]
QEAREIYPAMVSELKKDLLGISSSTLIPILVKGFQEQQTDINSLTAAIEVNQNDININKNLKIHSKTLVDEQNNLYANSLKLESNIELENDEFSIKRSDRMGNLMSVRTAKIMDENAQGYLSVKDSIEEGVEGLVHMSEMDWTNVNARPSKIVKLGQEVSVVVLDVQESKQRISLSMKQAQENPWQVFEATHNKNDKITVSVKSITDFGLFVGLPGGIDGLIHLADISWDKQSGEELVANYTKGQELEVVILNIDSEKERISLGVKQLAQDDFMTYISANKKGSIVKGIIEKVDAKGAVVTLADEITGYLKAGEISEERVDDAAMMLKIGEEVEVIITNIDKRSRNISVSIKAKNSADEKAAMVDYKKQSSEEVTGSTLGDLLKKAKK